MDLKLFGHFTLRAPLSHIGASESTYAELVRWPVISPDGTVVDLPVYAGNAWRGQLRDCAATYLLRKLHNPVLSLDAFHLLYSGGRIGGEVAVQLEQMRRVRRLLKPIELLGGGIGNQIVPGKLRVANCYPVCREAAPVLTFSPAPTANLADLLHEAEFTRRDDSKDERLNQAIAWPGEPAEQLALDGGGAPRARKSSDGPAQQQRVTVQVLAAGTALETAIWLLDADEVLLGCLVSALWQFARAPQIGGKTAAGYGLVDLRYDLLDLETGEVRPFYEMTPVRIMLAPEAKAARDRYDAYCLELYDALVAQTEPEIRRMLMG